MTDILNLVFFFFPSEVIVDGLVCLVPCLG